MRKPKPVPPVVPEQVFPEVVVPVPQLVMDELIVLEDDILEVLEAEEEIEPTVLAYVAVFEMDEDLEEEKESEMDLEEPD